MMLIVQIAVGVCVGMLLYRAVSEGSVSFLGAIARRVVFAVAVLFAVLFAWELAFPTLALK
jgi:uncharacterized membrane protein